MHHVSANDVFLTATSMPFTDFPLDIVLKISKDLDLPDSLHLVSVRFSGWTADDEDTHDFRQTCSDYRPALLSPSFWLASLHRIEQIHRRPLPCPPGLDIVSLPLPALRDLAIHAYRLRTNWSSDSPRPYSVHSFQMDQKPTYLLTIEGTRMFIAIYWTPWGTRLECWDTTSNQCVATLEHETMAQCAPTISLLPILGMCAVGMVSERCLFGPLLVIFGWVLIHTSQVP